MHEWIEINGALTRYFWVICERFGEQHSFLFSSYQLPKTPNNLQSSANLGV